MENSAYKSQNRWNYIIWLDSTPEPSPGEIGAKGHELTSLTKWGYSVPPGFIVSTKGYQEYVALLRQSPNDFLVKNPSRISERTLRGRSESLLDSFGTDLGFFSSPLLSEVLLAYHMLGEREMRLNLPVSVRSSAAHEDTRRKSYAGSYETSLNVVGENELLFAIRKCWASLWKKHLMLDYARQKIGETVNMAVVVQKMVCAEVAGVTFTADPISGDDSKLVINSSWGLGDQIVSGNVIADRFEVDKLTNEIVSVRLGAKSTESRCASRGGVLQTRVDSDRASSPSLDHHEILELSRICTEIARRFPYPVDIEWALENQTFYILQVRAVTTM